MVGKEIRQTVALAGPLILAQLAQMSMSFVDTIMVGQLGSQQLAGVAVGSAVFYPAVIIGLGILTAVSPMVSQGYGAGDQLAVGRAVRQGLWLGTLLAIPAFLVMWKGASLLSWMGQEEKTVLLAEGYLHAIMWGVVPLLWFAVLRHFVEGLSRPRVVMMITIGAVVLNIGANYVLMYGRLGFPALGLAGCGWASTLVFWSMFLVMASFIGSNEGLTLYGVFSRLSKPDWHYFSEILKIGWPIGVMQGLEVGLFAATALLMGLFGTTVLAAHQIALQCAAYSFMVPLGLSLAVSVRVGQATGRKDLQGARRAGYVGMGLGASFMMIAAICFWALPRSIISLFLDVDSAVNAEVVSKAIALLGVAAVFQVFDGMQVTAAGALRGLKDTRTPMIVALISYWFVGLSSGYVLGFYLDWDGVGLWWGLVLGLTTAAVLLSWRFRRQINGLILKPAIPEK
ncbi:MATE family efflux transporter [Acidobacteria bacterium AH-259-A15]|nr:MATE family efflux transporter [Acidobacteria bacterium AH-259-A15]